MKAAELAIHLCARRSGTNYSCCCPAHEDRNPSLSFCDGDEAIIFHCFAGCSGDDVIAALRRRGLWNGTNRETATASCRHFADRRQVVSNRERALELWHAAGSVRASAGESYLAQRGLLLPAALDGPVVRFMARCPRGRERLPALLALFRDRADAAVAIQRIFIGCDFRKHGDPMMLGPTRAAAIKLAAPTHRLIVCEGLEDGLGLLMLGHAPVWVLGSKGAIERFAPIAGLKLIVAADNDADGGGIAAGGACVRAWRAAGERAEMFIPVSGKDFADLAKEKFLPADEEL